MSGYLEICKCGHDISTHFRDPNTRKLHGCLGMRCDCPVYLDRDSPEPRIMLTDAQVVIDEEDEDPVWSAVTDSCRRDVWT